MRMLKTQSQPHAIWLDHAETAACCAPARHTDEPDYRERTQLFCDWYMTYGRRPDDWPRRSRGQVDSRPSTGEL